MTLLARPFVLAFVASFLHSLALHATVHLPGFLEQLGASSVEVGSLFSILGACAILARPIIGRVMDRVGRRPIIVAAGALHVVVCSAHLGVDSLGWLITVIRGGHGVVEAMLFSGLFTYAADIVPEARRTEGLAWFGVSGLLPVALAGVVGDLLLAGGSYRDLFWGMVVFSVLGLAASLALVDAPRDRCAAPPRHFFATLADSALLPIWLIGVVFATASASIFVFMKTYVLQTGSGTAGTFFAAYSLAAVALRLFFGWVPDRLGALRTLAPAIVVFSTGLLLLAGARSPLALVVCGVLTGAGHGYAFPILGGLVVARAPASERGAALAIFTAIFDVGMLIGGPTFGWVIERASYGAAYVLAAVATVAGLIAFGMLESARARAA